MQSLGALHHNGFPTLVLIVWLDDCVKVRHPNPMWRRVGTEKDEAFYVATSVSKWLHVNTMRSVNGSDMGLTSCQSDNRVCPLPTRSFSVEMFCFWLISKWGLTSGSDGLRSESGACYIFLRNAPCAVLQTSPMETAISKLSLKNACSFLPAHLFSFDLTS